MAKPVLRKPKKKVCQFCKEKATYVDYKDVNLLRKFISDRGKIRARRVTGNCVQHQRDVAIAVKNAREAQKTIESIKKARNSRAVRDADHAAEVKARLEGSTFNVKVRAGEGGRLFGAATVAHIATALAE